MRFSNVIAIAATLGTRDFRDHLRSMAEWHLGTIDALGEREWIADACVVHCRLATVDRRWAEADHYAEGFQVLRDAPPRGRAKWSHGMGDLAFAKGQYAEAASYFEQTVETARTAGLIGSEEWATHMLRACEDAQRNARKRKAHAPKSTPASE